MNNINNINNNNNNNNNNINNNNINNSNNLFLKVFHNIYIKNIIIGYLRLYNLNYNQIKFYDLASLKNYKYKYYLNSIYLILDINDPLLNEINDIIPYSSITKIEIECVRSESSYYLPSTKEGSESDSYFQQFSKTIDGNNNSFLNSNKFISLESIIIHMSPYINNLIKPSILPISLTSLTLNSNFNQPVSNGWLKSLKNLTYLKFGYSFNQSIPNDALSINLKTLIFGSSFRKPIGGINLPNNLQELSLPEYYSLNNLTLFPPNLQTFKYGSGLFYDSSVYLGSSDLPCGLTHLNCNEYSNYKKLPASLKTITFNCGTTSSLTTVYDDTFSPIIPPSVETIHFINLRKLFNNLFFRGSISSKLTSIYFDDSFNLPINDNILPESLTFIKFGKIFNHPITDRTFPSTLKTLQFGHYYNQTLNRFNLPLSLTSLHIDFHFGQNITLNNTILPENLQSLSIGDYTIAIDFNNLPSSLTNLFVYGTNSKFLNNLNLINENNLKLVKIINHNKQ
ncbi:hypothetical protein DICPUDRAFT_153149 [Dictyostelium purpureum]|uniref:FNIP repeat-containing protein n=1 Tax=Dictyostelium purpureum TaxID=5786 RepID=F0ZN62_DICPU|nr:uncharacterized protein DICPUDRAFT_153149 [Dictyostelium purpureum]EGC34626.1 hypothetical protein DICPUDRAFT_153149 [Dictyostelium purpureum]|eukprot:XP_003288851.1 hypothetical protein DICPUDRAFT_153149 [Dictyostelium purpureum]